MTTNSNRILSIYKSRLTICELLDHQSYNTEEYEGFSINEIDAMYSNQQLDMLVEHRTNKTKTYVTYYLNATQIKPATLEDVINDLYFVENVLTKEDTLTIIVDDEPNDSILTKAKYLYDHDGIFVVLHNINRLQYNILNHKLVPECVILDKAQVEELKKTHNIAHLMQLPEISRFDPQALAIGLRPGQVCMFNRESATAMFYKYYRVCV